MAISFEQLTKLEKVFYIHNKQNVFTADVFFDPKDQHILLVDTGDFWDLFISPSKNLEKLQYFFSSEEQAQQHLVTI